VKVETTSDTSSIFDLEREGGRYFDATEDLSLKCVEDEPLKQQFQSSSPEESTGDAAPSSSGETNKGSELSSSIGSNDFEELSFKKAAADKPSASPNAPQKPCNEKWDKLIAHLERARTPTSLWQKFERFFQKQEKAA
jgi:hypothetical protein